jgi:AsmA protein
VAEQANPADTSSASLGIEQILIENSHLVYNDKSMPLLVNARDFNYKGSGDLSKDVFDLIPIPKFICRFLLRRPALRAHKKVNADLVTSINTKSLAFAFQKNDLLINQFTGSV